LKKFLETILPEYKLPSRAFVNKELALRKKLHEINIKNRFDSVSDVALSADLFYNARKTYFLYLGVHFFNRYFQYTSAGLAFKRFTKSDFLSEKINMFIKQTVKKFKIADKLRSITTNNSDVIIKAVNGGEFGTRISCLVHNLNSTLSSALSLDETKPFENECDGDFDDDIYYLTDEEDNEDESIAEESIEKDKEDLEEVNQFSDDEENETNFSTKSNNEITPQYLYYVINKVRRIVRFILKTDKLNRYVRSEAKKSEIKVRLVIDLKMRWHSTFVMLERFLQYMKIIDSITTLVQFSGQSFDKFKSFKMTSNDWIIINSLVEVLQQFNKAVTLMMTNENHSLSLSHVISTTLKRFLSEKTINAHVNSIKDIILHKFVIYFEQNISVEERSLRLVILVFRTKFNLWI